MRACRDDAQKRMKVAVCVCVFGGCSFNINLYINTGVF